MFSSQINKYFRLKLQKQKVLVTRTLDYESKRRESVSSVQLFPIFMLGLTRV